MSITIVLFISTEYIEIEKDGEIKLYPVSNAFVLVITELHLSILFCMSVCTAVKYNACAVYLFACVSLCTILTGIEVLGKEG